MNNLVYSTKEKTLEQAIEVATKLHQTVELRDKTRTLFIISPFGDVEEQNLAPSLKVPFKEMVIENAFRTQKQLEAMVEMARAYGITKD